MSPLPFTPLNLLLTTISHIHALRRRSHPLNTWQRDTKEKVCGLDVEFSYLQHVAGSR